MIRTSCNLLRPSSRQIKKSVVPKKQRAIEPEPPQPTAKPTARQLAELVKAGKAAKTGTAVKHKTKGVAWKACRGSARVRKYRNNQCIVETWVAVFKLLSYTSTIMLAGNRFVCRSIVCKTHSRPHTKRCSETTHPHPSTCKEGSHAPKPAQTFYRKSSVVTTHSVQYPTEY